MTEHRLIVDFPPELLPLVAAHLPLGRTPATLLSLALVDRQTSEMVLPVLWATLILRNIPDTVNALQRILDDPDRGLFVRSIHIDTPFSSDNRVQDWFESSPAIIEGRLRKLIQTGLLPALHTLEIREQRYRRHFGSYDAPFWNDLRTFCPRIQTMALTNVSSHSKRKGVPWLIDAGVLNLKNIRSLTVQRCGRMSLVFPELMRYVGSIASTLHTFIFDPDISAWPIKPCSATLDLLFDLHLPVLERITLLGFLIHDPRRMLPFWSRHTNLEFIHVFPASNLMRFLSPDAQTLPNFLPKLKHLRARFEDVRLLSSKLHQLSSLWVLNSFNCQVAYLIREVIPAGLPNLKSLSVHRRVHLPNSLRSFAPLSSEGLYWHEKADGIFSSTYPSSPLESEGDQSRPRQAFIDSFVGSVLRGAPNLVEFRIALSHGPIKLDGYTQIPGLEDVMAFQSLQRFFFFQEPSHRVGLSKEALVSSAHTLAREKFNSNFGVDFGDCDAHTEAGPNTTLRGYVKVHFEENTCRKWIKAGRMMEIGQEDQIKEPLIC
ncbi:hypothetical protein FA15DRAFT_673200 [Coprinopsis marcescibilis]|uniref:Uncharacterized protein n=1 Tax=Coprinopsis marcescibilis TaxID=230819 RepID=A0A5C3KKL2_COPMA|nr:hypothetical protein FA15DRAFT_673200 [Coprinopsis marcescibilis]